ncbi:MAG: hypothetical protein EA382_11715, partial [Spirochaetaceae bacterium]
MQLPSIALLKLIGPFHRLDDELQAIAGCVDLAFEPDNRLVGEEVGRRGLHCRVYVGKEHELEFSAEILDNADRHRRALPGHNPSDALDQPDDPVRPVAGRAVRLAKVERCACLPLG